MGAPASKPIERPTWYLAIGVAWLLLTLATIQGGKTPMWPLREIWLGAAFAAAGSALLYFLIPHRLTFMFVTAATTITPFLRTVGSVFFPPEGASRWQASSTWLLITVTLAFIYKLENRQHQ